MCVYTCVCSSQRCCLKRTQNFVPTCVCVFCVTAAVVSVLSEVTPPPLFICSWDRTLRLETWVNILLFYPVPTLGGDTWFTWESEKEKNNLVIFNPPSLLFASAELCPCKDAGHHVPVITGGNLKKLQRRSSSALIKNYLDICWGWCGTTGHALPRAGIKWPPLKIPILMPLHLDFN